MFRRFGGRSKVSNGEGKIDMFLSKKGRNVEVVCWRI
jgi:hypothetical protein